MTMRKCAPKRLVLCIYTFAVSHSWYANALVSYFSQSGEDDEDGSSDSSSQGGHRFDAMFGNGGSLRGQMHPPIMSPQALLGHGIAFAGPGTNTQGWVYNKLLANNILLSFALMT